MSKGAPPVNERTTTTAVNEITHGASVVNVILVVVAAVGTVRSSRMLSIIVFWLAMAWRRRRYRGKSNPATGQDYFSQKWWHKNKLPLCVATTTTTPATLFMDGERGRSR